MANLEPLKNMNTLLTQVLNFAEKDPSLVKMLELAGQVAKYWRPAPRESASTSSAPVEIEEEQQFTDSAETVNSLDKIQVLNSTLKSLGNVLELVNQLAKQIAKFGPLLTAMMKYRTPFALPPKTRRHEKFHSAGNVLDEKAVTNTLITLLIPVLILNIAKKPSSI
jgi:hypothetical protein